MSLKKIVLIGFKSFADKTTIDFNDGITSIVGPNGCGKSNISDAVQWVLGEQSSKQLRGKTMQDVIFSGTENRKSMGYSQVSLYFDNTDKIFDVEYSEVVVSRKLYRSGESEYFINNSECRLKDIKNMLYNSGLGKEGYSIIGQGKVSEILNSKPEDRRSIFEDAAGISHFKAAKNDAERKLSRTIDNLNRNYDILSEIERTLFPLKKQSDTAKKYIELKEDLKIYEINNYIYQYDNSNDLKKDIKEKINELEEELKNKNEDLTNSRKQSENSFNELNDIDSVYDKINSDILKLTVELEKFTGSSELLKEKSNHLDYLNERKEKIVSKIKLEKKNLENNRTNFINQEKVIEKLSEKKEDNYKKHQISNEQLTSINSEIAKLNEQYININTNINKLETRIKIIEDMKKNNDSFKYSVKNLLKDSGNNSKLKNKIVGVIADLIQVPEGYETSIEMALGSSIQNIVTNNEDDAKNLIEYLKMKKYGRVTFLPLTTIKPRKLNKEQLTAIDGFDYKGIASEIVKYDVEIKNIVEYLLGSVIIVKDIEDAIAIGKKSNYTLKIVTLDGEVFSPGGSISGGINVNHSSSFIIGRESQIDKLKKEYNSNILNLDKVKKIKQKNINKLEKIEIDYEKYSQEYNSAKIEYAKEKERFENLKYLKENSENEIKALKEEEDIITNLIVETRNNIDNKNNTSIKDQGQLGGLDAKKNELQEKNNELVLVRERKKNLQLKVKELEEDKNLLQEEITKLNNKKYKEEMNLSRIDTDLESMQEAIWEEYGLTYSSSMDYKKENYNYRDGLVKFNKTRKDINALGYINVSAIEEYKAVNERYVELKEQVDDLEKAKNDLVRIIKDLSKKMINKFNEEFEKINNNFNSVFKELFGGGFSKLELTDPVDEDDELTRGIEIYANPPGKKLKNILQLSGGERALTAIAILFSILKLRPMPFCLLDEIEAALDDANIARFSGFLKKFSKETQFIVITHRKPTMQVADLIYGVTMPEKGVSKIVGVSLKDAIKKVKQV